MPKEYHLRTYGDPVLREVCKEVTDFSDLEDLLDSMKDIMRGYGGQGIAAPQIGDTRRVIMTSPFLIGAKEYINPKIIKSLGYIPFSEGCLSLPNTSRFKLRKFYIKLEYQDRHGKKHKKRYTGISAIVLQHEIDHLDGKLIID